MFEIAFSKAASEFECYIPWEFIPLCNCPWVEGILVVIPYGCRLCVRVLYGARNVQSMRTL